MPASKMPCLEDTQPGVQRAGCPEVRTWETSVPLPVGLSAAVAAPAGHWPTSAHVTSVTPVQSELSKRSWTCAVRSTATGIQLALAESDESRQDIREAIVTLLEHSQS